MRLGSSPIHSQASVFDTYRHASCCVNPDGSLWSEWYWESSGSQPNSVDGFTGARESVSTACIICVLLLRYRIWKGISSNSFISLNILAESSDMSFPW